MKIISLVIATVVIAMFISGFFTFTAYVLNANGASIFSNSTLNNISATQTSIETMYNTSANMQNNTNTGQVNVISFAPWNLVVGAYDMVKQALTAPLFFISMIGDLTTDVTGLPVWVSQDLIAIISVIVVWEFIYLIIGRK